MCICVCIYLAYLCVCVFAHCACTSLCLLCIRVGATFVVSMPNGSCTCCSIVVFLICFVGQHMCLFLRMHVDMNRHVSAWFTYKLHTCCYMRSMQCHCVKISVKVVSCVIMHVSAYIYCRMMQPHICWLTVQQHAMGENKKQRACVICFAMLPVVRSYAACVLNYFVRGMFKNADLSMHAAENCLDLLLPCIVDDLCLLGVRFLLKLNFYYLDLTLITCVCMQAGICGNREKSLAL